MTRVSFLSLPIELRHIIYDYYRQNSKVRPYAQVCDMRTGSYSRFTCLEGREFPSSLLLACRFVRQDFQEYVSSMGELTLTFLHGIPASVSLTAVIPPTFARHVRRLVFDDNLGYEIRHWRDLKASGTLEAGLPSLQTIVLKYFDIDINHICKSYRWQKSIYNDTIAEANILATGKTPIMLARKTFGARLTRKFGLVINRGSGRRLEDGGSRCTSVVSHIEQEDGLWTWKHTLLGSLAEVQAIEEAQGRKFD